MKHRYIATFLAALAFQAAGAQETPTIITQAPKGTVYNLCRSTTGYEAFFGNPMKHESNGDWQRLVFGWDGAVYLEEPINAIYTKSWIKGKEIGNDTIAFELPQAIFSETYNGTTSYGYAKRMTSTTDGKYTRIEVDQKSQVLKYVWKDGKLTKVDDDVLGLVLANDGWTGYGEDKYEAFAQDDNTQRPEKADESPEGLMLYMALDGTSQQVPVKIGIDGETAWMGALTTNMKNHWIKGEVKGGLQDGAQVVFPNTQFLGIDTITRSYMYVSSVKTKTVQNEYGTDYDSCYIVDDPIVFTYSTQDGTFSTRGAIAVHKSSDDLRPTHVLDFYRYAQISPWINEPGTPMPPIFSSYMPWDASYGYAGAEFKISFYSVQQEYLDPSCLYYNFYIDGERQTFSADEYSYLESDMVDVPYSYSDQYDFYKLDENNRRVYFYKEPKHKLGLEALYIDKDNRLSSGITEYLLDETGIDDNTATAKRIASVEYTDLTGRRVSRPTKGIYVRTITFDDGTKESKKVMK